MEEEELIELLYKWEYWARPNQIAPEGDWSFWLLLAGRGFGKTRTGAEWIKKKVDEGVKRIGLIAPTAADTRDVMIKGESGLLSVYPPYDKPEYTPSNRSVNWANGCQAITYSAEEPDRLRGPQHEIIWADEMAVWRYPEAWDMAKLGLRLGLKPQAIITTTPKPVRVIRELLADKDCVVSKGTTYDNVVNLAHLFFKQIISKYEGTRLGRQEIYAEVLEDIPGALWTRKIIDDYRVKVAPDLVRVVVAIDPAVTSKESSDETGITASGKGGNGEYYVLDDKSCRDTPRGWAARAIKLYHDLKADLIVGEVNNGGDLVKEVIKGVDPNVNFKAVRASRGKYVRAEPVSSLYEQGKVHHVGIFEDLEDQQCQFVPGDMDRSPDRADSLVWGLTELSTGEFELLMGRA